MDDRNRRNWSVASDRLGPGTAIRPRLTRRGIGGVYAVIGNPVSWTVDPVLGCLPWISLSGGRDAQSQATRAALLQQGEGTAFTFGIDPALPTTTPTTGSAPPASSTGTSPSNPTGSNVSAPTSGPFGYIGLVKR